MADADRDPLPRSFWWLFAAGAVSWLGDGVIVVGFPLLAAALTKSPLGIAAVIVTQRLAPMLLALPLGALADRWNARRTAAVTNVLQAALFAGAAVLTAGGHLGLAGLIAVAFVADSLGTLFTCASSALVADVIIEPRHFGRANTWLRGSNALIAYVIGPGFGGLLYATGRQLPLIIDACSFLAAAGILMVLRTPNQRAQPEPADRHFLTEVKEGVRISFSPGPLRLMVAIAGSMTLVQAGSVAAIVVLGTRTVGLSQTGFGWALAAGNIAAVGAMLSVGRITKLRTSSAFLVSIVLGAVGELLLGTAHSGVQISVGLALDGGAALIIGVVLMTARMRLVPREQLGRMTGGYESVLYASGTVGTILGGVLADASGRLPYLVCAAVYVVILAVGATRIRGLDAEPEPEAVLVPAQAGAGAGSGSGSGSGAGSGSDATAGIGGVGVETAD
ncbi:MFS transporter [Catenulispora yoronensis]|uniref:MFS transporter n=1 Tax=Catenulispora yoronensis TaxID=450799 RepID=A0ABP5FBY0_9ACTN